MEFAALRDEMVASLEHETKAVVESTETARAMRAVPRHEFVDAEHRAYTDQSFERLGTRVLSPSAVGLLVEALAPKPGDDVLVVGAGVGYTAAVIAEIVGGEHVHALDIDRRIVYEARGNLADAGYDDVLVDCQDGARGLPEYAPFDRVLVEAGAVRSPEALVDQLTPGGRLVFPKGASSQRLVAVEDGGVVAAYADVTFAPLLVDGEQASAVERNRTVREDREHAVRAAESRRGWEHEWIDWDG
ncbi:protein-L-isoaspartate O-methyltransferase family protein [Halobacterium zhouii]|uniref:protein-L-isoaspartate O-methyltransferase family protein n=1 Tax=Halobacterium zhouii TaxID=2902624 RepID=UPI001E28938B|nr:protein-L-isoaspartate O-methyltransferase [Halobacterium zhouii]